MCVWSVVLFQLEEVEREQVAGNWLLNSDKAIPEDSGESEITHTLRHGMPLENCRSLCMPYMRVCISMNVCFILSQHIQTNT